MVVVGIECTAHTFGVGVVHKGKILANIRDMYRPERGGIIPIEAAKHHKDVAESIWNSALEKAGVSDKDIKAIALSNAPGLAPCLLAGRDFARKKAKEILSIENLNKNMKEKNIVLKAESSRGTLEEAPEVYKDVDEVVRVSHEIGIGKKIAKLIPLAVLIGN